MSRLNINRVRRTVESQPWAGSVILGLGVTAVGTAALTALKFPVVEATQVSGSIGTAFGSLSFVVATALNGSRSFEQ